MNRAIRYGAGLVASLLFVGWTLSAAADEPAVAKDDDVARLVKDATEGNAAERRAAGDKLVELGKPAVAPLASEAETARRASMYNCFDLLGRLLASDQAEVSKAAREALDKLSESKTRSVALRATTIIRLKEVLGRHEAMRQVAAAPPALPTQGAMKFQATENGKSIQLERTADGTFTGKIEETVNGEKKSTDIQAGDTQELEKKFPDAHRALQKQQEALTNAANNPFGPIVAPQFPIPPIAGRGNVSTRVSIVNGDRKIEVREGDDQIEVQDKNGRDITLKHTRTVDGKRKTDEYKATDFDDLKKKHPEAAKLYEKYAAGNNGGVVGAQIQIRAVPGGFPFRAQIAGTDASPASTSPGPRTIRAEQDDRKIEIADEDGRKIRVKVIKLAEGKETTEEFSADDLKGLKTKHPEIARLYEKYTGTRAE